MTEMLITEKGSGDSDSLRNFARSKLEQLEAHDIRRELTETVRKSACRVEMNGRELISFSCNDYLGLSHHPKVIDAARQALERYGAGAGASRLVTGNCPPIASLERRLAEYKKAEAAIVFGSGYLANVGIIPALVGPGDLVVMDELAHACMHAGARLSGAEVKLFKHNSASHAGELLDIDARRKLLLTETVFSMDGDCAPIADLAHLAIQMNAWFMTDDAHGLGVLPVHPGVHLQMGTLSKTAGSYGGYLCAPGEVVDLMKSRARPLVYSTGLPPSSAAAAEAALAIMSADPDLCARPLQLARLFCTALNLPLPESQIVPLIVGEAAHAVDLSARLADLGYLVTAIRPPTVPAGTARLRVTFCAAHQEADVEGLASAIQVAGYRS